MPDVMSTVNDLKSLPDQALQMELTRPSGAVPAYLVLAEAQRRQTMRQAAQADRNRQPVGSVYDDVIRDMMARQPPPGVAPAGATPPPAGPPAAPPTPQNFRPAAGMAAGGEVEDDEEDDDGGMVEMPRFDLKQAVADTARRHNLDPADLWGVVKTESGGNPNAIGPKTKRGQAAGLMQLMPGTAQQYGVTDRMDPQQSLEGGASYLRDLYRMFGDWDLARAAYNAGPGNVKKYRGVPPFSETRKYIERADNFASQFQGAKPGLIDADAAIGPPAKMRPDEMNLPAAAAAKAVQSESPKASETSGLASLEPPAAGAPAAAPESPDELRDIFPRMGLPAAAPAVAAASKAPKDPYSPENLKDLYNAQNDMRALPVQQNDRERAIQNMIDQWYAEAQKRKKPTIWDYMANFGMGMASTPSRNWAQSIAGGAVGMIKGINEQQEDARKQQLEAMGIDLKLDDQMRSQQQKQIDNAKDMAKTQQTAYSQAAAHEETLKQHTMQELLRGRTEIQYQPVSAGVPPGYEVVTPDLLNPSMQYVAAPMRIKLDPVQHAKLLPFLPGRQVGDMVPYAEFKQAQVEAAKAAQKPAGSGIKLTGADALIALSLHLDPLNMTPEGAKQVLDVKNKADITNLADLDPKLIQASTQLQPGQRNEALLASLQPGEQSLVRNLANYQAVLPTGSAQREPTIRRALNLASLYDPTFNAANYDARRKMLTDYTTPGGAAGKSIAAMGTVSDHLERWEQNAKALANYGGWLTPLNAPKNWLAEMKGDPRVKPVLADQEAVGNELMRAWRQVGAGSEKDIENWKRVLGPNSSPAEQAAVVKEMYGLINGKLKQLKEQFETGMGRPWDFHMLNPEVKKRMAAHGVDVSDLEPGATYGAGEDISKLPVVSSKAEYDALPVGARYVYKGETKGRTKKQ